ncbi:alcohol dehydrogenase superfamily, zinc-containing [Candidatus Moduliflexus flocculans]|uniref:Alcohol dehydrogenase superfamily, zinc-containing n=1 Tax=Candidatus Moduliflexus flocculans TaxID=1499966 RepID=A0A081BNS7_9BACT|nr:alcohol dehydrogenase superfamily, zinc-containing [Candidatus Moduliflexus flocculans]
MKAIRVREFGLPQTMVLEEVADLIPANNQVVVKLNAIGVNPVDAYCRSGAASWVSVPFTPGIDGAGTIARIGAEVAHLQIGQRVYTAFNISGTYAEEVLCEASQVYPLPDSATFEEGAALFIPYATAYRGLFQRSKIEAGETVLVHGASGAVGIAATQFAVAAGCSVIGSAGTEQGQKLAREQGAQHTVNHYDDGHFEQVLEITNGRGVDVIIEPVSANVKRDIAILANGGRITVIGDRTPIEIDAQALTSRDAAILGTNIGNLPPSTMAGLHAILFQGLKNKTLRPIISQRIPLAEASRSHEKLFKSGALGKIILIP